MGIKRELTIPDDLDKLVVEEMCKQYMARFSEYAIRALTQQVNRDRSARERAEAASKARRLGKVPESGKDA